MKTNLTVSFAIIGDMQPDEITSILDIEPSQLVKKGEERKGGIIAKTSIWKYEIDYIETVELAQQFKTLIIDSGLANKTKELLLIQSENDIYMRLDASINIYENEKPVIWIEPIISEFASKLDISIDIETYFDS